MSQEYDYEVEEQGLLKKIYHRLIEFFSSDTSDVTGIIHDGLFIPPKQSKKRCDVPQIGLVAALSQCGCVDSCYKTTEPEKDKMQEPYDNLPVKASYCSFGKALQHIDADLNEKPKPKRRVDSEQGICDHFGTHGSGL